MLHQRPSVSRPVVTAFVACLLAIHAWLSLTATIKLGVTADETAHLTGGYSYWRFNDYRLQPENGNLPQRWAALPLLALQPHMDPAEQPELWSRSHVWRIGQGFFFESGNNTDFMLLAARAAMLFWSIATGLLVFIWSRRLWGDGGGLLSLSCYALSPTTLAHAPLVTSDMCAAFCLLASAGAWSRATRRIDVSTVCLSLLAAGLAAVSKFSCVLLLPIASLIALCAVFRSEPIAVGHSGAVISRRGARFCVLLGLGILHVAFAWIAVWASFGFRYEAFSPALPMAAKFFVAWPDVMPDHGVWRWLFETARGHHLLPEAYLQGFAYVLTAAKQRGAFAAGQFSTTGWWWFFPYSFLVKSSISELLVTVLILVAAVANWRRAARVQMIASFQRLAPLIVIGLVYIGFSLSSHLNIGHRHILPLYPLLFIIAGALLANTVKRATIGALTLVCSLAVLELGAVQPHFLAFFNSLSGGPAAGWRHLVDSSLDWGQNLPRLAEWLKREQQPGEHVYLSMFGSDDPVYNGIDAVELAPYYSFGRRRQWVELKPGLYCISATMLQDVYSPFAGPWTAEREAIYKKLLRMMRAELARGDRTPDLGEFGLGPERPLWNLDRARFARLCILLRARKPEAVVGHTVFVHRLTARELHVAIEGTFVELAAAAEASGQVSAQGN
jgi:hypothetical protein